MATRKRREQWYSISVGGYPVGIGCGGFSPEDPVDRDSALSFRKDVLEEDIHEEVKLRYIGPNYHVACQIASAKLEKDTFYKAWKESKLKENKCY